MAKKVARKENPATLFTGAAEKSPPQVAGRSLQ